MTRQSTTVVLIAIGITSTMTALTFMGGCGDTTEQVWSTRNNSGHAGSEWRDPASRAIGEPIAVDLEKTGARASAIELLKQAVDSSNPLLRANAIEALQYAPNELEKVLPARLADENRGVRFIAVMSVGQHQLKELIPLVLPLVHDEAASVRAAAIYALHACGEEVDPTPLASMLLGEIPEAKANAAMILGELGDDSALPMLRTAVGRGMSRISDAQAKIIDLQIAEAMVKLGEERELEGIRATLFAPAEQGELIALACQMLGRLNDVRAAPNLADLATREGRREMPAEVRMAATLALADLGTSAPVEVPLRFAGSPDFSLRAQAAVTLGGIFTSGSSQALRQLLTDSNPMVQIAAAGGILRHSATTGQVRRSS
ncbi:MAG: HEAT repeat domain-containing protein [Phycisphaerales bacterium]|nr:MAG: HEAT repeat domain-containing protein [Phycisphaerales bacterium]